MGKEDSKKGLEGCMPGMEFEGPMGMFWMVEEVPTEALGVGLSEILDELKARGIEPEQAMWLGQKWKARQEELARRWKERLEQGVKDVPT